MLEIQLYLCKNMCRITGRKCKSHLKGGSHSQLNGVGKYSINGKTLDRCSYYCYETNLIEYH